MRHIKHSIMWVSLVVILPLLWKGISSQVIHLQGYSIEVASSVRVQEGLCVTIPCKFTADGRNTFSNSFGYWRDPNSDSFLASNDKSSAVEKPNFHLTGNPDSGDCTLTITDARRDDEGEYFFRFEESKDSNVKYGYIRERKTSVTVTAPVTSHVGRVIAGRSKTLTCAPPGNCSEKSIDFQWKKSNVAGVWKNSSTVTFIPSLDDHQETITCEITNIQGMKTQKNILLDVCCPTSIMITGEINGNKENIIDLIKVDEGSSMTLTCSVQSNLTLNMTWSDEKNNVLQQGNGKKLELRLQNITLNHTGVYTCSTLTENVIKSTNINVIVHYPPRNMKINIHSSKGGEHPASQQVRIDSAETLTLVCSVEGNPNATVVWVKGEFDIETSNNGRKSAMINVMPSTADVYRCLAWNTLGLSEQRIQVCTKWACITATMDLTVIIGMVIGNVGALIIIFVGSCFCMKQRMKKNQLVKKPTNPRKQRKGSTYQAQDNSGNEENIYCNTLA
ncbi:sialic acid-binding Ig-like lectin 13 [Bufo gargarizans]|uniref:sialic acid-binding Ig-like lectin 13 n=1 Tax=Bufo gargarizans TaxID=30331 RepID=UPI001CF24F0E|nr:sialic acid-binding Ig-like lectin 13 [Bufo gargarizans]XP_044127935.1 sialic acid-binding Ig-like lectin 13 [Bufo gargarizans]